MSERIIGTRVRKTMSEFQGLFSGLTDEQKIAILEELELLLAEIRTEVQSKKNAKVVIPDDELSQEHKANGVRVRKTISDLKSNFGGLSCENKEIMFDEIEMMVEGIRTEVQAVKNNG